MKFQLISDRRPIPSMTSAIVEPTARHRKARCQNGVLMIRHAGLESRQCDTSGFRVAVVLWVAGICGGSQT